MEQPTCLIDDLGPLPIEQPATVEELAACLRDVANRGEAVYPLGGGTGLAQGYPPTRPGTVLCTRSLDTIVDYVARDMTVTVQTGITLAKLQAHLATENLRLPVDVPQAEQATLGGALAANVSGPRRLGYGTLRDYVLGIQLVNDEGQATKAGGRVVKNVAGYDLCKLYIGSLGTLGIITQVTLKLRPHAEERALLTLGCESGQLEGVLNQLHSSRTRPVCVDVLNQASAQTLQEATGVVLPGAEWVILIGYEDNQEAVRWQIPQLLKEMPQPQGREINVLAGRAAEPLWTAMVDFPAWSESVLTFKANLLPGSSAALLCHSMRHCPGLLLQCHAGNGIVLGHLPPRTTLEEAATFLDRLSSELSRARGNVVVLRCPTAWKATLPIWGIPRADVSLMRRVKAALDPRNVFNPGRFIDRL